MQGDAPHEESVALPPEWRQGGKTLLARSTRKYPEGIKGTPDS